MPASATYDPAPAPSLPYTPNRMHPLRWVPAGARTLVDVGCNSGDLLADLRRHSPHLELAGVDVNASALARAGLRVPDAELHRAGAEALPFAEGRFDVATCIEVLEHVPAPLRRPALREIHRVLKPGGVLLLRVPHAGITAWLDSNNFRFRFAGLYRRVVGRGMRDAGYAGGTSDVVWHHHFTVSELLDLAGAGWEVERTEYGGLLLYPVSDILSWPFYRLRRIDHPMYRALQRLADFDLGRDYGAASFDVMLVLRRQ